MKKWAVILILIIFTLLKLPTLNTPFYQDELTLVDNSFLVIAHPAMFIRYSYIGHPPLIESILILAIKTFHFSLLIPHIISLCFSLLALFFFYKIIEFYSKKDALFLTILLALTPIFFTQAGILNLDMPVCSLLLGMYYFYIKKRPIYFTIFSSLAILAKEPAFITYTVILIYDFLKKEKNLINYIKTKYYYSIPYLCWSIWLILSKIFLGHFIYPGHVMFIHPSLNALNFTFIHNYRFLLLPFLIIPLRKKHSFLLTAIIFSNLLLFSFIYLERYLLIVIPFIYILFSQVRTRLKFLVIIFLIAMSPFLISPNSQKILAGEESNLSYIKLINIQKSGFNQIPNNSQVLMLWPHFIEARAIYGYTKNNFTIIRYPLRNNYLPEYAYASSLQNIFKSKEYNQLLEQKYTLIFTNESYGNYVKVYKRKI